MKKFISMALALVMSLSLCAIANVTKADAAFEDVDELSSKYAVQAADVIQTIEVMDGYDDGTFRPTAGLTRQAAAKIICNMILGPTTARALPTNANPFPDVIAGNQFAGYISYCAQQGIISGYADGTFRGGDPLSGYAYLKMLLGALGYSATEEGFVGDNWKVNVAKTALGIGLNKGIEEELDGTTQVTREAAAIYAFNTLQGDMVEYASSNTLEINGVTVTMGGGKATPQTWNASSTSVDNINASRSDGNNARPIVQFAERYFDKLVREPNGYHAGAASLLDRYQSGRDEYTTDDFGRPSIKWFWKGVEIGTYPRDPDATFVGGTDVNKIYEALNMTSGDSNAHLYINSQYPNNERLDVSRSNDKGLDNSRNLLMNATTGRSLNVYGDGTHRVDRIGDGTLIECFRNDANNHVDVCVISVYGGKVDAVKGATSKKDAYVTISFAPDSDPNHRPDNINVSDHNQFETEDFEEDDVVAYTYSDSAEEIKSMYVMTAEGGTLQSRVSGKSLTLDDTKYSYGKEYTFNDVALNENGLSTRSSYIVYLDENGYVLWVEEDEFAVDQYVLVERISVETSVGNSKTTTASVLGSMEDTTDGLGAANSVELQKSYGQSKSALGTSSWDARARVRYSNGTVRTLTLDDSKNYRTDATYDGPNQTAAEAYYAAYGNMQATTNGSINSSNQYVASGTLIWRNTTTNALNVSATDPGAGYAAVTVKEYGPFLHLSSDDSGDGDGNWIAEPFTAGHIVRLSGSGSSYRLHTINDSHYKEAPNFTIENKQIKSNGASILRAGGGTIVADSDTHFVIDDVDQNTYKYYVGIKNAPDVQKGYYSTNTVAYIYHSDGVAKLVFVTSAQNVSNSSNDVIFLAANSTSNLVDSDDGLYYDVNAVDKNEVKTLRVKAGTTLYMGAKGATPTPPSFKPGANDDELHCVILNEVTYDSNDFITAGYFTGNNLAVRVQGIRRANSEEVRLDTHSNSSYLRDIAENVRVYFIDGDDIDQIDYDDIVNDTMDIVYYVEDDGEITYLFIVDYDEDAPAETAIRFYGDGELEVVDATNFTYHMQGTTVTPAMLTTILNSVKGYLQYGGVNASIAPNGAGGYTATVNNISYTVTIAGDGRSIVTGPARGSGTFSTNSNVTSARIDSQGLYLYTVTGSGTTEDPYVFSNYHATEYIPGMDATVTFTVPSSIPNPRPVLTITPYVGATAQTPITYETAAVTDTANQYTITFPVPLGDGITSFTASLVVNS